ncbi:MAG: hypothetical protein ACOCP4_04220 [Candidatus Woesearchaeota archaeon]
MKKILLFSLLILFSNHLIGQTISKGKSDKDYAGIKGQVYIDHIPDNNSTIFVTNKNLTKLYGINPTYSKDNQGGYYSISYLPVDKELNVYCFRKSLNRIQKKEIELSKGEVKELHFIKSKQAFNPGFEGNFYARIISLLENSSEQKVSQTLIGKLNNLSEKNKKENSQSFSFRISEKKYNIDQVQSAISKEFGSNYRVADWNDVKNYKSDIQSFVNKIGGMRGDEKHLLVTRNGEHFYSSNRHYYISYHNHHKPSHYQAHDNIDNFLISLGSWKGKKHILVIKKE